MYICSVADGHGSNYTYEKYLFNLYLLCYITFREIHLDHSSIVDNLEIMHMCNYVGKCLYWNYCPEEAGYLFNKCIGLLPLVICKLCLAIVILLRSRHLR